MEEIDTAGNEVRDERLWFFDIVKYFAGGRISHEAAVPIGLVTPDLDVFPVDILVGKRSRFRFHHTNLGAQQCTEATVLFVEFKHVIERKRAAHVGMHYKEMLGTTAQHFISEMIQATGCA